MVNKGAGGPGKSYRKGMTLMDLFDKFPDNDTAEKWFIETRWPGGLRCPRCEGERVAPTKHPTMPFYCSDCRKRFSAKTGSVMEGSNLGYRKWAIAIYILTTNIKGTSSMKLHRDLGITQKHAWHMAHRVRENWFHDFDDKFIGPVEADETYVGGKERNKHKNKKMNAGRGTVGKAPVVGIKDRNTGLIVATAVASTSKKVLQGFVEEHTEDNAPVFTDEHASYKGIDRPHGSVNHSAGEYVSGSGLIHTAGIDSFWAGLKRGIYGSYHHVSVKHLGRYAGEFAGRHNDRPLDTEDQMEQIARGMTGKRLRYSDLIGKESTDLPEGQMAFDL